VIYKYYLFQLNIPLKVNLVFLLREEERVKRRQEESSKEIWKIL